MRLAASAQVDQAHQMLGEHYGILEVHLWSDGCLNEHPSCGMRLDNVGPKVRKSIRGMGRVGDVGLNKIVRVAAIGSSQLNPLR